MTYPFSSTDLVLTGSTVFYPADDKINLRNELTEAVHIWYEFPSPVNIGSIFFASLISDTHGASRCLLKTWVGTGKTVDNYNDPSMSVACNGGDLHSNEGTVNCEYAGATALHILWYPIGSINEWHL